METVAMLAMGVVLVTILSGGGTLLFRKVPPREPG